MISEPALTCKINIIFDAKLYSKLCIAFKMAYFYVSAKGGNLDFPDFLPKSFITVL